MVTRVGYNGCGLATVGAICTVTCATGYYGGSTKYTCQPDTTWGAQGPVATCAPVTYVMIGNDACHCMAREEHCGNEMVCVLMLVVLPLLAGNARHTRAVDW